MTKKMLIALAAVMMLLPLSSCDKDKAVDVKMKVTPQTAALPVGETLQLEISVEPAGTTYTCTSDKPNIATVSETGLVTGVAEGEAVISVKAGNNAKEVRITVTKAVDKARYLGLKAHEAQGIDFLPVYIPEKSKFTAESRDLIKSAMELFDWQWKEVQNQQNAKRIFVFEHPDAKKVKPVFLGVQYVHTPPQGNKYVRLYPSSVYKPDPFTPLGELDDPEIRAAVEKFQKRYLTAFSSLDFTNIQMGQTESKQNFIRAQNKALGLNLFAYTTEITEEGNAKGYWDINIEISYASDAALSVSSRSLGAPDCLGLDDAKTMVDLGALYGRLN